MPSFLPHVELTADERRLIWGFLLLLFVGIGFRYAHLRREKATIAPVEESSSSLQAEENIPGK
jgi:hypothetical protein